MELLHLTARSAIEWMLYGLMEGSILALLAWVLLRLLPRQNAGTRFALWFSVLLTTFLLPFVAVAPLKPSAANVGTTTSHGIITLSDGVALDLFCVWAAIVVIGLLRVLAGLWQVNQILRGSEAVDSQLVSSAVRASLAGSPRSVSLRLSDRVQVAAAIGFLKPAIVIPRWFLEEITPAELEQVVLHELSHLRRRDDWTNLAQKIIHAVLFFHPFIWWLEQRLSLERELACDEAVLAQSASPHGYAQCLTRLAERSLVRKSMALAQGVVGKVRQLSFRVAQILDVHRPSSTRIWKPAVPLVLAAAALCAFSAWSAPVLVSFHQETAATRNGSQVNSSLEAPVKDLPSAGSQPKVILAGASASSLPPQHPKPKTTRHKHPPAMPAGDYVVQSEQLVVTTVTDAAGRQMLQVHMWRQVRYLAPPVNQARKTVSRKNI